MCNKFPQQPRYHVFLKLDTLNLRPDLSRLVFARSVDGLLRNEMEDTAAGAGIPVRGEAQPSRKEEGSDEKTKKRNRHKGKKKTIGKS